MSRKNVLIVGGTSGLGMELAMRLMGNNHVTIVGRKNPDLSGLKFIARDLSGRNSIYKDGSEVGYFMDLVPRPVELFIFTAGFYQDLAVGQLTHSTILEMLNVGLMAPISTLSRIIRDQDFLPGFIAVTSTSQWTPRLRESVYTAVKAGLGMFANSVSLDPAIGKTLLVAPAGMKTPFWKGTDRDTAGMLEPEWVAERILDLYYDEVDFKFKHVRIMRDPARIELVEKR